MNVDHASPLESDTARVIHLDYAAATPIARDVWEVMEPLFIQAWANPGAIYKGAVAVHEKIMTAREALARTLRIRTNGIIFTSGGTESNNLVILGIVDALRRQGRSYTDMEVISTRIEHPSVLEVLRLIEERGVCVRYARVDEEGVIDMAAFKELLSPKTILVTLAYVNSEIGVIQDIKKISRAIRAYALNAKTIIYTHVDACQAPLWLSCEMDRLGVDLMSLDAGKCYGPKGVGVLAMRHGIPLEAQLRGGGQEYGLRSTTENAPAIVGCVHALIRAQSVWKSRSESVTTLRDFLFREIEREIPEAIINGSRLRRVANNVNVSLPGFDTEFTVVTLDAYAIEVATRSACGSKTKGGSHVVYELTKDTHRSSSTLRLTLGEDTTQDELTRVVQVLKKHVGEMRIFHTQINV